MSLTFTDGGRNGISEFRKVRRDLQRAGHGGHPRINLKQVPFFMTEGDSWFSLPVHYNIVDFLEQEYRDGIFLRFEKSGDILQNFLHPDNNGRLLGYIKQFRPDAVLLSGGGNDLVDELALISASGRQNISVDECIDLLNQNNFFERMRRLYQDFAETVGALDPAVKIIAHGYDYPVSLGKELGLTVENIGLAAVLVRSIGSWISPQIEQALPQIEDQKRFVRRLIDQFESDVLSQIHTDNFFYADLRGTLQGDQDWNDEMHPTEDGFRRLAERFRLKIDTVLTSPYRGLP